MTTTLTDRLAWAIHRPLVRVARGLLDLLDRAVCARSNDLGDVDEER